jgi:hypothetical protein
MLGGDMPVMEMAEGGEVDAPENLVEIVDDLATPQLEMDLQEAASTPMDPNQELSTAIDELMTARTQAEDQGEVDYIDGLIEAAEVGSQAPMADLAIQLSRAGRGDDVTLAHLRPGEVVIPPEAFDDPEFESLVEQKFIELDLDPEAYVVGSGIASLNPVTGLEEFGWFKKTWKSVKKVAKKVVKPIAQVAQFIPGPWQAPAALIAKASTVYDVAKGRANPLALAAAFAPLPGGEAAGKGIGSLGESISKFASDPLGSVGRGIAGLGRGVADAAGNIGEFVFKGADDVGLLGNIGKGVRNVGEYVFKGQDDVGLLGNLRRDVFGTYSPSQADPELVAGLKAQGLTDDQIAAAIRNAGRSAGDVMTTGTTMSSADLAARLGLPKGVPQSVFDAIGKGARTPLSVLTRLTSGNPRLEQMQTQMLEGGMEPDDVLRQMSDAGLFGEAAAGSVPGIAGIDSSSGRFFGGKTPQFIKDLGDPFGFGGQSGLQDVYGAGGQGSGTGGTGSGSGLFGGINLKDVGAVGLAALLGKLAYDEAKDRKGVPLTPLTQMNAAGRYNIEAEIARRMGQPPPDPVEFGLLPADTLPVLSGGRRAPMEARYGGPVMRFAEGGGVDMAEFKQMDGDISGPGTEISDDIPAMLSDGEFVMTGQAVRGAGAFDMKNKNGIITLTPSGKEDRDAGTRLMYQMMDLFAEFAEKPRGTA